MAGTEPQKFDRWNLAWGRTWAYRLFEQHHRQINQLYWTHVGVFRSAYASTSDYERDDHASVLFTLPDPSNFNLDISLGQWADQYDTFGNWVRLSSLVSITGYLEVYLKTAIRLAIESDPGVVHDASGTVDGVRFLKANPEYSFHNEATDVVIGDWNQRIAKFKRYFGQVPSAITDNVSELEDLRRTRNGVTHTFGRNSDDYDSLLDIDPKPLKKVSEKKLVDNLRLIYKIVQEIDEQLGQHIGDYESVYFYHNWDGEFNEHNETEAQKFKEKTGALHGRGLNWKYYRGLIDYYRSL